MMRPGSANHDYRDSNVLYLALLCSAVYFCSYLTRINYSAVLVEIITSEHYTKQAASAALTGMFISYGIFQPFSGFLGDHIKPEKVVMGGLLAAGLLNLLIAVCTSPVMMTVVWTANGVAQSMLWPPIVKIMAEKMITADYEKYLSWISVSAYISQILIYLAAPTVVHLSGWRMLFLLCGTFAILMALLWFFGFARFRRGNTRERIKNENSKEEQSLAPFPKEMLSVIAICFVAIVLQGMLRDGTTSWLPTFLQESFNLRSGKSILSGVLLPVFSIPVLLGARTFHARFIPNEMRCSVYGFSLITVCCFLLFLFSGTNPLLSAIFFALIIAFAHTVNFFLIGILPARFTKTGHVGTLAGVLNGATYIGSALSTYGVAVIADVKGWNTAILIWLGAAICGLILTLLVLRKWTWFLRHPL